MSQPLSLMPTPPATAVWDWSVVLDSAIQSDSDDDEAVAEEAAARERAEAEHWEREAVELHRQEEAERQEREENECWEKEENECWEREENECWEREAQAQVASQVEGRGLQSCDPEYWQRGHRVRGGHKAEVNCTYKLAKATSTKKVQKCIVLAESTSLRAGEKKKRAWAKSLEVEVVGGSLQAKKGKSVARDTLITSGLYAIATTIDQHTKEMAQLWQMVKTLGSSHHHVIESMAELLQEMTYPEPELPAESGSEESEEAKASDKPGRK
ncbi:hypothetical protein EDD17DRAFT_1505974 [Pisolithus thermaeus]|nr:hypothetical protein EDD17DRAFT_1505974 [Pisolithus thermaeus]